MTEPSIFSRILHGEIPGEILLETPRVFAIRDIAPQAPVHLLVIPKTEHRDVSALAAADPALLAEMIDVAQQLADEHAGGQYRLIFNTGADAGQTVFHVHAHVLGGFAKDELVGF